MALEEKGMKVGSPVWARFGAFGWRPAVVESMENRWVCLRFESGNKSGGRRDLADLVPRDPALKGKDKPTPKDARLRAFSKILQG